MAEYNHDEWLKGVLSRSWEPPKPAVEEYTPPADDVGGFQNAFAQSIGNTAAGIGQFGADYVPGVSKDNALKSWGERYSAAHPTAIHSLEDVKARPLTAASEAVGGALGFLLPTVGTGGVGGALKLVQGAGRLSALARTAGAVVSKAGPAAIAAAPSYGSIREAQGSDTWQDKALALPAAAAVGAIETAFGPQEWALRSLTVEGRAALAKKFAADTLAKRVGKGVATGAAVEGAEELVQNPIEQAASYRNPFSEESMRETAFGGVMGAIGGGVLGGGMAAVSSRKQNLLKPTERVSEPSIDATGMTPDMFTGEVGPSKDVYQTAFEDAARVFTPTDAQGELFPTRQIPGSTGYGAFMTKAERKAAARFGAVPTEKIEPQAATVGQQAAPRTPSTWADIEATVNDHLANGRMTEEQADAVKSEAKTPAKARKMIEKAVAETGAISPVNAAVAALDTFSAKLPKQQKSVFGLVRAAAESNELDKYISADGEWQATAMGEALGMTKQAAHKAVRDLRKKLDSEAGGDVKAALAARTAAVRSYEAPVESTLGLSPAQQSSVVNQEDLFGNEEGAQQSMGVIESIGGSQGEVGEATAPPGYAPSDEITAKAAEAARENKLRSLVEAAQNGDLAEAVNTWNDFVGTLPGVEEVSAKLSANEENVDFLAEWVNAYIDVRSEVEAHQEAGKFIDEVGAYEYEVKRIVRNRQRDAEALAQAKSGEAQKAVGSEAETGSRAGEDGGVAQEQVAGQADTSKVTVTTKKRRPLKMSIGGKEVSRVKGALNKAFFSPGRMNKVVTVVEDEQELPDDLRRAVLSIENGKVRGVVNDEDGRVYLIAKNIPSGHEMAVLLHEVGVHLGMKKLVGEKNFATLVTQLQTWALDGQGLEGELARQARNKVRAAESGIGADYTQDEFDEEFMAYFVELAVARGVTPTVGVGESTQVKEWLRKFAAAVRAALRKFGINPDLITAKDLVDLAYGAAHLEMSGERIQFGAGAKKMSMEASDRSTVTYTSEYAMQKAEKFLKKQGGYKTVSVMKTPEGTYEVTRVKTGKKKFSVEAKEKTVAEALKVNQQVTDAKYVMKKSVGWMTYLHDLVRKVEKEMPSAKTWYEGILKTQETRLKMERDAEKVAAMASDLKEPEYKQVNAFLENSTVSQKWGYAPEWNKDVTVDADLAAQWNALSKDQQKIADAVFKHGFDSIARKRELFKKLGVQDVMSNLGSLTGPYAPLKRFGKFVAVLKSQKLLDAEAALKEEDNKANRDAVEALKKNAADYQVSRFDTPGQAEQFVKDEGGKYAFADSFSAGEKLVDEQVMSYQAMQTVMSAVKADPSLPAQVRTEMENTIRALYLSSLDETNARQSGQKRKNTAGFHEDMVRSFLAGARADAAYVANLEHGGETNDAFYKMQEVEVKDASGRRKYQDDFNLLAEHYAENMKYDPAPIQDRVVGLTSAWQLTTSLAYHLTNMTQGFMVTLPRLAAEGNYGSALKHLMDGYKIVGDVMTGLTADLSKVKDSGMREALELAANRGILDVGIEEDLGQFDQFKTGYKAIDGTSRWASMALHRLRGVSRAVETVNRVSSGAAAYAQAIEQGKSKEQAQQYVIDILQSTQGDFSRIGAPLLLKRIPKVMAQYRKYQFMMMAFYVKAFNQAFKGATAEERAIGKRMLAFKLTHTAVAAGALGLPLMNLFSMMFGPDDDDPEDLEMWLKSKIGNEDLANLLLHGVSAVTPLDMSAKLGEENIFSVAPYTDIDLTSREGVAKTAAGIAGGPAMGLAQKMADGVGLIQDGQTTKGVERLLPSGLGSALSAFRMANEGFSIKNGDVVVKPGDMETWGLALTAVGLPASQIKELTKERGVQFQLNKHFDDRTKEIRNEYSAAWRDKDREKMAEMRKEWIDLQKQKRIARKRYFNNNPKELRVAPLSSLIKTPAMERRRARTESRSLSE